MPAPITAMVFMLYFFTLNNFPSSAGPSESQGLGGPLGQECIFRVTLAQRPPKLLSLVVWLWTYILL